MLDEFRRIAEAAIPLSIQNRLVTPDEARAVISSFNRLTDGSLRTSFLNLPVDNIIEFSMMQTKKRPSLYNYMTGITEVIEPPEPTPETEPEHIDTPVPPPPTPIVETKPPPRKKPEPKPEPRIDEKFFRHLTERLERLTEQVATPTPIVVETTNVEKLLEVEQAMLGALTGLTERVEQITLAEDTRVYLTEMLTAQKEMIATLNTSQQQIAVVQARLIESQNQIVETIGLLAGKIADLCQTPPVVNPVINVPAPIVNVTVPEGRRTKTVERDANNLISRIVEGYED